MEFNQRPLLIAEDDDGDFSTRKVLLIPDVFVGAQKHIVPGFFRLLNQFAVLQLVPANPASKGNFVARKTTRNRLRSAIVE